MTCSIPTRPPRPNWPVGRKSANVRPRRSPKPSRLYRFMIEKSLPPIDCQLSITHPVHQARPLYPAPIQSFSAPATQHDDAATKKSCLPFMIIINNSRQNLYPPKLVKTGGRKRDRRRRAPLSALRNLVPDKPCRGDSVSRPHRNPYAESPPKNLSALCSLWLAKRESAKP